METLSALWEQNSSWCVFASRMAFQVFASFDFMIYFACLRVKEGEMLVNPLTLASRDADYLGHRYCILIKGCSIRSQVKVIL